MYRNCGDLYQSPSRRRREGKLKESGRGTTKEGRQREREKEKEREGEGKGGTVYPSRAVPRRRTTKCKELMEGLQ